MLKIKNWSSMQSYKDRRPPWIRLHKTLLDDFEFHSMSVNARALLPMLWLLASEDEDPVSGLLRDGYEKIAFRLRMQKNDVESGISECVNSGFIDRLNEQFEQVTGSLRNRNQTVTPETETEAYRTDREETDILAETVVSLPKEKNACRLDVWMKREGIEDIPHEWGMWASTEHALPDSDINSEWMKFTDYWKANGTANARKKDWQAAWRTWIRNSIEYKSRRK